VRLLPCLLALPLLAQAPPEPGASPALRARIQGTFRFDPLGSWRSFIEDGMPVAVVEVVAQLTEDERHDVALEEALAKLKLDLREMFGRYGESLTREHRPALLADSPAKTYPLGVPFRP